MKLDGRWVCFIIECNGTTGEFCSEAGSNFRPVAPFHLFPKPARESIERQPDSPARFLPSLLAIFTPFGPWIVHSEKHCFETLPVAMPAPPTLCKVHFALVKQLGRGSVGRPLLPLDVFLVDGKDALVLPFSKLLWFVLLVVRVCLDDGVDFPRHWLHVRLLPTFWRRPHHPVRGRDHQGGQTRTPGRQPVPLRKLKLGFVLLRRCRRPRRGEMVSAVQYPYRIARRLQAIGNWNARFNFRR